MNQQPWNPTDKPLRPGGDPVAQVASSSQPPTVVDPQPDTVLSAFERQAEANPLAIALRSGADSLDYRSLNAKANKLAHYLRAFGARPEVVVGISIPRSIDMVVAVLGVMKSGGAYLPLDPSYPANRLALMMADSGSKLLIGKSAEKPAFEFAAEYLSLESHRSALADQAEDNPIALGQPEDLAYVIYTSGSTGRPKGVEIINSGVTNLLHALQLQWQIGHDDVMLCVSSFSFDISVIDMLLPLANGATVDIVPSDVLASPSALRKALEERGVTRMLATPGLWRLLIDAGLGECRSLTALVGGDALPYDLAQALLVRTKEVWDCYGPTEITVCATMTRYVAGVPLIGRPLANVQALILDECGQPVRGNQVGELHIGGAGLARGYRNLPALTAEKFIFHPLAKPVGSSGKSRLYKTGDLARYAANGDIECLGRIDRQVKVRGYRIELGEIETRLRSHPSISNAAVVDWTDSSGERSLGAYYVATTAAPTAQEWRDLLKRDLPEFMIPAWFVAVPALPLTANGKLDREALPAVSRGTPAARSGTTGRRPSNRIEVELSELWRRALDRTDIGVDENFFEIGGHSLMAVSLTLSIENHFSRVIPLDALWTEGATIAGMAAWLGNDALRSRQSRLVPLRSGGTKPPLFVMHTLRGSVNEYHAFASHLAADRPVIGVRSRGLFGDDPAPPRIAEFARDCVDAIRDEYPDGPYLLAGYSVGGLIAYEAGVLLEDSGHRLDFLGLFDTPTPAFHHDGTSKTAWTRAKRHLKGTLAPISGLLTRGADRDEESPGGTHPSRISTYSSPLYQALRTAATTYRVSSDIAVPIDLFVTHSAPPDGGSISLGWELYAKHGVRGHRLQARSHGDMMKPEYAEDLARAVARQLSDH